MDSSHHPIYEQLQPVLNQKPDSTFLYLYYRFRDYTPDQLEAEITQIRPEEVPVLWNRIQNEYLSSGNLETLDQYYQRLKKYLDQDAIDRYDTIVKAIANNPYSVEEASKNPFEEHKLYALVGDPAISDDEKYQVLLRAMDLNEYAAGLIKSYCYVASNLGLKDYVNQALNNLRNLISPQEFRNFKQQLEAYQANQEKESWD
jgi:hypothetical protein